MLRSVAATALAAALLSCQTASSAPAAGPVALVSARPARASAMHMGAEVMGPYAFYDFCHRVPHECEADPLPLAKVELTPERWAELNEVNDVVNKTVLPMTDWQQYGVADYWAIATKYGDCEKYALTKQLYLRQRGWPMNTLLITVVLTEKGEGHAVLTVRTAQGDFVLDNRQAPILAWSNTPYTFLKRQSPRDPKIWLAIQTGPQRRELDPTTAAAPNWHRN